MAKKSSSTDFREIITSIKKKEFSPIYLLMGEEDYYIDQITEMLENSVVSEEEKDFNSTVIYGADAEIREILAKVQQYPVMADRQIVLLKEAQTMSMAKSQLEKLAIYAKKPNPLCVFVISYKTEPLPASSSLVNAINSSNGIVFKSEKLRDYQLQGPVTDYIRQKGINIDERGVALLCEYIGTPLSKLFKEIDKLIVAAGETKRITPELIEEIIGISKDYNSFELIKRISLRDYPGAMKILNQMSKNPRQNPGVILVATLFNYFSKLFIASILKDKSDSSIMQELDLKTSYALTDYRNGLRNYNASSIDAIIHAIREQDAKSKGVGSTQNEYELLKELLFKIFTLK